MAMVGNGQDAITREILQKKLKRAPPPKAPDPHASTTGEEKNPFQSILRTTGKRASLLRENFQNDLKGDSGKNELAAILQRRRTKSEKGGEDVSTNTKPKVDDPPWKQNLNKKKTFNLEPSEEKKQDGDSETAVKNGNELVFPFKDGPPLQPLPSLLKVGKAPKKPPKSSEDSRVLINKYTNNIIVAPKDKCSVSEDREVNMVNQSEVNDNSDVFEQEDYDDVTDLANEVKKRIEEDQANPEEKTEFEQEDYDDVGAVKQAIEEALEQDTYDDVGTTLNTHSSSNIVAGEDGEEFGEDVYEPVKSVVAAADNTNKSEEIMEENYELLPGEMEQPPPKSSNNNNDKKNSLPKVDHKKLKKEQEELKKKQREESKRLDKEKKRQEEEKRKREKINTDLKKKHKLKGEGVAVGNGLAKDNWKGTGKQELPLLRDESVFIISRKEGCPSGKWLIRNEAGYLGYVPADMVLEQIEEDEYAEIDSKLLENIRAQQSNLPPPSGPAPNLPSQRAGPADEEQETYDDVKVDDGEELYEPINN